MIGPYAVDWFDDYGYVIDDNGQRIAECEDRKAAELVCASLNATHYAASASRAAAEIEKKRENS